MLKIVIEYITFAVLKRGVAILLKYMTMLSAHNVYYVKYSVF